MLYLAQSCIIAILIFNMFNCIFYPPTLSKSEK